MRKPDRSVAAFASGAFILLLCSLPLLAWSELGCSASARLAHLGCGYENKDDFFVQRAICLDDPGGDLELCLQQARETLAEEDEYCQDVLGARLAVCEDLQDAAHEPEFGGAFANQFVDPFDIGVTVEVNPYFPLVQGNRWVYEASYEEDGEMIHEVITIEVLAETKHVDGVDCLVVRDVVTKNDLLVEDTDDWFAQDTAGNVWYCGEEVKDYEFFEGDDPLAPELISNDGSFKAGVDGAEAGILLPVMPEVGQVFRQEISLANAEDVIEILSTTASETSPAASCVDECLMTRDYTPLDPGVEEHKFYLPGIGRILEIDLETGDRFELTSFTLN